MSRQCRSKVELIQFGSAHEKYSVWTRPNSALTSSNRIKPKTFRLCMFNLVKKSQLWYIPERRESLLYTRNPRFAMCSQSCQVVWRRGLEGEFFFRNEFFAAVFVFTEILLAKKPVSNFPEHVWLHRSPIKCFVQLNFFAVWRSENDIKSHSSVGHVLK